MRTFYVKYSVGRQESEVLEAPQIPLVGRTKRVISSPLWTLDPEVTILTFSGPVWSYQPVKTKTFLKTRNGSGNTLVCLFLHSGYHLLWCDRSSRHRVSSSPILFLYRNEVSVSEDFRRPLNPWS